MAYVAPSIGTQGLTIPSYTDIRDFLLNALTTAYPQNTYQGIDQSDYQMISAIALKISDTMALGQLINNGRSLLTAAGAELDALGSFFGTYRKPPSFGTVPLTIGGAAGTVITSGVAGDSAGNRWNLPATVEIPPGGTIIVTATAAVAGSIPASAGSIVIRVSGLTSGWTSVTNATDATAGRAEETDSQYRARLAISVALPSRSLVAGTVAGVQAILGVTRTNIDENPTGTTDANGVPAHSISMVVEGGTDLDVATAIYQNKGPGCGTYGNTTVNVTDPSNGNLTLPISFSRPTETPVYTVLGIHPLNAGYTTATQMAIKTAVQAYINSLQIGETLTVSGLYFAIGAVLANISEPSFSLRYVYIGTSASPTTSTDLTADYDQVYTASIPDISITAV